MGFEVERFEWAASGDRIELAGRWYDVRGRRFLRPTLDVEIDGDSRRLLALLEHKPWAAEEGEEWLAAFAWEGDSAGVGGAQLTVGPDLTIVLDPPSQPGGARSAKRARPDPRVRRLTGALDAARAEFAEAQQENDRLRSQLGSARADFDEQLAAARGELAASRAQLEAARDAANARQAELESERDAARDAGAAALAERDAARAERDEILADTERGRRERDAAVGRLEQTERERDAALAARDKAREERNTWLSRARDAAAERDAALVTRDSAAAERDAANAQRDQARNERDQVRAAAAPTLAPPRSSGPIRMTSPSVLSPPARRQALPGWAGRLIALVALIALIAIVVVVASQVT